MSIKKIFKMEDEEYKNYVDPIKTYMDVATDYISTIKNIPENTARIKIKDYIKKNKRFNNRKVYFYQRDLNGKRTKESSTLLDYINYYKENDDILVPSFTVYFNPKKKKSLHAEFISKNVKERSKFKKLAFKYKIAKDWDKFNYNNTIQKSKKIANNSLSGGYASAGTVLNNPSAHYTLTSMTRCVSGIGNAISESLIMGNRQYKDPNTTLNHITTLVSSLSRTSRKEMMKKVIHKYNIYIPTADDVMEALKKSFSKYWRDTKKELSIYHYLEKIDGFSRAYVLYHIDMYHFRKHNDQLMRNFIDDFINYDLIGGTEEDYDKIISNSQDWLYNLLVHNISGIIKGKKQDDWTIEDKRHAASALIVLERNFIKYKDLFQAFFITEIFPPAIAYIKDMLREAIVLSDTDSTCATYQDWVDWYFGGYNLSPKSVAISAVVMTITTQVMDHYIKMFGGNMNIGLDGSQHLEMKNEFFWDVFVNTERSKHYYANVVIQEGNVYDLPANKTLELKGVNLISPNSYQPVRDIAQNMMIDIMKTIANNKKIEITKYLNIVLDAEDLIINKLKTGSPDVLKLEKMREEKAYKNSGYDSPFIQHLLWQEVFAEDYGDAPDPTYMTVKLPTVINSKKDMKEYLESIENDYIRNKFKSFLERSKKEAIKTFKPPLITVYTKGIPKEMFQVLDIDRVVKDNCGMLYIILETLGFYVKEDMTLTKMLEQ